MKLRQDILHGRQPFDPERPPKPGHALLIHAANLLALRGQSKERRQSPRTKRAIGYVVNRIHKQQGADAVSRARIREELLEAADELTRPMGGRKSA